MNLGQIKAQFAGVGTTTYGLMNRRDLKADTALVSTFIDQAILRIQRELRAPFQEATIVYTIPANYVPTTGLAIPNDFLELIGLFAGADQEVQLQRCQLNTAKVLAKNIGSPVKFARFGGNWIIGNAPVAGDVITIQYYASFPALVAPTDENVLSIVAWDAVLYGALSGACDYYNDERLDKFEKRYNQILQNLQNMADADELTADAAVGPVFAWPED